MNDSRGTTVFLKEKSTLNDLYVDIYEWHVISNIQKCLERNSDMFSTYMSVYFTCSEPDS